MRFIRSLPFLFGFLSMAFADVEFIDPKAGASIKGGDVITAHWKDSGKAPRISELEKYDLYLCAGGDAADTYEDVATLVKEAVFARGNSVSFHLDPAVGGHEANAYFLKMVASGPDASITNYSNRFTLTNMTGSFSSHVTDGINSISNLNGPGIQEDSQREDLRKRQNIGAYTIPFASQIGATRYAPMPKKAGSTIASGTPPPQNPTTAYSIATAYLPAATVQTTKSATATWEATSIENTASPAPRPDSPEVHMKRFLERWKD